MLAAGSMLVTNFVILPFWASDILTRESRSLQRFLAAASFSASENGPQSLPPAVQSFLEESLESCLHWGGELYPRRSPRTPCQQGLPSLLIVAETTGVVQASRTTTTLLDLVSNGYLYVALPDTRFGAVAAGIPLAQVFRSLWAKEQVIAVYLVFNAVVLAALAFFRLLKAYVLPVDRMVQSAENYQSDGLHPFLAEKSANELGQLSRSIQAMVQRIEADKHKLTEAVGELAVKNSLLEKNQREMIRAEKLAAVGRLAAGLAHEIGNPLGVAQGYLQLLGMGQCTEQERDEYTGKALRELERMDGLIRRLLDYARTGQGAPTLFDAHALLAEMIEDLAVQPFLKGMALEFTPQAESGEVCVDREQLRQVILNGVLNAADAIDAAGRRDSGKITIATTRENAPDSGPPVLRITIADNGIGIPAALLDAVFDPFFTTKEPGAGTGLGLSVSLALVESMGGRMELRSQAGEGTAVLIAIPLAAKEASAESVGPGKDETELRT